MFIVIFHTLLHHDSIILSCVGLLGWFLCIVTNKQIPMAIKLNVGVIFSLGMMSPPLNKGAQLVMMQWCIHWNHEWAPVPWTLGFLVFGSHPFLLCPGFLPTMKNIPKFTHITVALEIRVKVFISHHWSWFRGGVKSWSLSSIYFINVRIITSEFEGRKSSRYNLLNVLIEKCAVSTKLKWLILVGYGGVRPILGEYASWELGGNCTPFY